MKKQSPKSVNAAIKKAQKTTKEVVEDYGFASEEDLTNYIEKVFDKKEANKLLGLLEDNDAHASNEKKKEAEPKEVPTEPEESADESTEESMEEIAAKLSKELVDMEIQHKETQRRGIALNREAKKIEDRIRSLTQKVEELKEAALAKQHEALECVFEMAKISREHNEKQKVLEKIKSQIEEAKMVYVFVNADGTIEAFQNNKDIPLEFGDWEKASYDMFISHKYNKLSGEQLNMLAKLLHVKKELVGYGVDFSFDQPFLELAQYI